MNTRLFRRGFFVVAGLSIGAVSGGAVAQPIAERIEDRRAISHLGRQVTHGGAVWGFEGPHELRWQFGYDATPLTTDAIPILIGLVNDGRPISLVPPNLELINSRVELTLRGPDGTEARAAYPLGRPGYHSTTGAEPGGMVTGLVVDPRDHFGELTAGVHHLRVRLIVPQSLQRSRDQHEITAELDATTPELRFEIVERPLPTPEEIEAEFQRNPSPAPMELEPIEFQQDAKGRTFGGVTRWIGGLYEPLVIRADVGAMGWPSVVPDDEELKNTWGTMQGRVPEDPVSAYPILERWSDEGWVRPKDYGFCGTGMGWLAVGPGHILKLWTPFVADTDAGVYRFVFNAQTASGAPLLLHTPAFQVPIGGGVPEEVEVTEGTE